MRISIGAEGWSGITSYEGVQEGNVIYLVLVCSVFGAEVQVDYKD
jgi:hypothetical protein